MRRHWVTLALLVVTATACGGQEDAGNTDGTWVGTITTEGNVTTVVNESGSVWGGTARLIEEASIGVDAGAEEYMLGAVGGVYAADAYIIVTDRQAPAVRVYGLDGRFLRTLGREGQGPGEYTRPALVTGDATGRIFVLDSRARRFNVFTADGDSLDTWPAAEAMCCTYPMVAAPTGNLWARRRFSGGNQTERPSYYGLQQFGPDGPVGEIRFPAELDFEANEVEVTAGTRTYSQTVPFGPVSSWVTVPSGAIVTGAGDRYRFEIQHADGSVIAVERRGWEPVPVHPDEAAWRRDYIIAGSRFEAGGDWTWDGAEIPATKPAFSQFIPTASGDLWVRREGLGEHLDACAEKPVEAGIAAASESPCWRPRNLIDAFDAQGRYLGPVEIPAGMRTFTATLQVRGDQVVSVFEDEAGVIMVKRYRLVLPGEQ